MRLSWSKRLQRQERIEKLRELFDAQCLEFNEDNLPTQIATFFEDVLAALPHSSSSCNIEGLFKHVLDERTHITIPREQLAGERR